MKDGDGAFCQSANCFLATSFYYTQTDSIAQKRAGIQLHSFYYKQLLFQKTKTREKHLIASGPSHSIGWNIYLQKGRTKAKNIKVSDWIERDLQSPTGVVQSKLLKTNPLPNSIRGNWQRSKLIGVEVSDPAISQDSPALQSSTLFAIVIMMITIVIFIILILTTVCTWVSLAKYGRTLSASTPRQIQP